MGVYIKGMEMPKNCGECKFFAWKRGVGNHCAVASNITFHATIVGMNVGYERNGDCPLIELPPHGRLIDADALMENAQYKGTHDIVTAWDIVAAPTIIEAEEVSE